MSGCGLFDSSIKEAAGRRARQGRVFLSFSHRKCPYQNTATTDSYWIHFENLFTKLRIFWILRHKSWTTDFFPQNVGKIPIHSFNSQKWGWYVEAFLSVYLMGEAQLRDGPNSSRKSKSKFEPDWSFPPLLFDQSGSNCDINFLEFWVLNGSLRPALSRPKAKSQHDDPTRRT